MIIKKNTKMKLMLSNKMLKVLFSFTLLMQIASLFIDTDNLVKAISVIASTLNLLWLLIIYKHSTIKKTIYFGLILTLIALLLIGVLFKIQHWVGANLIMTISILGLMITYLIRVLLKKHYNLLDWSKFIWFECSLGISIAILKHWIPKDYSIINTILFLAMIGIFCLKPYEKSKAVSLNI